ncbi:hypothetical protein ACROYT_G022843 [Oculina patagonica]
MAERLDIKTSFDKLILICVDMHLQVHLNHFWCKVSPVLSVYDKSLMEKHIAFVKKRCRLYKKTLSK